MQLLSEEILEEEWGKYKYPIASTDTIFYVSQNEIITPYDGETLYSSTVTVSGITMPGRHVGILLDRNTPPSYWSNSEDYDDSFMSELFHAESDENGYWETEIPDITI